MSSTNLLTGRGRGDFGDRGDVGGSRFAILSRGSMYSGSGWTIGSMYSGNFSVYSEKGSENSGNCRVGPIRSAVFRVNVFAIVLVCVAGSLLRPQENGDEARDGGGLKQEQTAKSLSILGLTF